MKGENGDYRNQKGRWRLPEESGGGGGILSAGSKMQADKQQPF